MCTLLFAHDVHPAYPLVIAANRDEFYARPTRPAGFWSEAPDVLAGRDLRAGGTWLGITRHGRWAGVTNVREPARERSGALSRGQLVSEYLRGAESPERYVAGVAARGHEYGGFNLVVGDMQSVWYLSNHEPGPRPVEPGVHGVSNHLLDTPWPKIVFGRARLSEVLARTGDALDTRALFEVLADEQRVPDDQLPDTGVGIELERVYAPIFVSAAAYGTCSSTVIAVHAGGDVTFIERTTNPSLDEQPVVEQQFSLRA